MEGCCERFELHCKDTIFNRRGNDALVSNLVRCGSDVTAPFVVEYLDRQKQGYDMSGFCTEYGNSRGMFVPTTYRLLTSHGRESFPRPCTRR